MRDSLDEEVRRYVRTGEHDNHSFVGWPGSNLFARGENAHTALAEALVTEVRKRTPHAVTPEALTGLDPATFARAKVAPMVQGLFPRGEQQTVLNVLAQAVVFLTPGNIEQVLRRARWLKTAWDLANLYLCSFGAELLSEDAPQILGLSEETTCYVSVEYFTAGGRFADFVVHETAHVFHNCKRRTIGLRSTLRREWILDIDFAKRETFAYACEAYSRILELSNGPAERRALLLELEGGPLPPADRLDTGEYVDVLREAVTRRNGWKQILARCAPPRRTQHRDPRTA